MLGGLLSVCVPTLQVCERSNEKKQPHNPVEGGGDAQPNEDNDKILCHHLEREDCDLQTYVGLNHRMVQLQGKYGKFEINKYVFGNSYTKRCAERKDTKKN